MTHEQMIQELLAKAEEALQEAAGHADMIGTTITFRGIRYTPSHMVSGTWSNPTDWQSSDLSC